MLMQGIGGAARPRAALLGARPAAGRDPRVHVRHTPRHLRARLSLPVALARGSGGSASASAADRRRVDVRGRVQEIRDLFGEPTAPCPASRCPAPPGVRAVYHFNGSELTHQPEAHPLLRLLFCFLQPRPGTWSTLASLSATWSTRCRCSQAPNRSPVPECASRHS